MTQLANNEPYKDAKAKLPDGGPINASKNVLLRLPGNLAAAVDQATLELGQTRSSFIREALGQRLAAYQNHEREIILFLKAQTYAAFDDQ